MTDVNLSDRDLRTFIAIKAEELAIAARQSHAGYTSEAIQTLAEDLQELTRKLEPHRRGEHG